MLRISLKIVPKWHRDMSLRLTFYDIRHQFLDYIIKSNDRATIESVDALGNSSVDFSNGKTSQTSSFRTIDCRRNVHGEQNKSSPLTDTPHPSFYETLGDWPFRDGFKKRTRELARNLFKGPCRNNSSRLYGTYFTDRNEPLKNFVDIEMRNVLENSPMDEHPFIVHFLTCATLLESVHLQKATRLCTDRPIIVLSSTEDQINARCCVPRRFVTDKFSAHLWLTLVANALETEICSSASESNMEEVCHLKPKKLTSIVFDERLETAMELASNFARINM